MTDPIADMIIRIKNALLAEMPEVVIPHSKVKEEIAKILMANGYVESFDLEAKVPQSNIRIKPRYVGKMSAITDVKRISKPGRRIYASSKELPRALGGYGITIVSTSKGIMTDRDARKQNVGGEVLCQIW